MFACYQTECPICPPPTICPAVAAAGASGRSQYVNALCYPIKFHPPLYSRRKNNIIVCMCVGVFMCVFVCIYISFPHSVLGTLAGVSRHMVIDDKMNTRTRIHNA